MKTFAWFCVALAMALVLITAPAQAAKEIKIGIVDCYSADRPATYTNDVQRRLQDWRSEKINAAGGDIWAARSKSLTRDSKFKVDIGLSAAKELIYRENVDVLMGTINSALALAISDMCKKEKVPFFRHLFQERQDHRSQGAPLCLLGHRKHRAGRQGRRRGWPGQKALYEILDRRRRL
jgi:branched-chain amino acid transport system substrate-binding protein